jgi:hypothetical protein
VVRDGRNPVTWRRLELIKRNLELIKRNLGGWN